MYGIYITTSIDHAIHIDIDNGNILWRYALSKNMLNIGIYFEVFKEFQSTPSDCKELTGHSIWDLKMDFTCKAKWFIDGHKIMNSVGSMYPGVVSREYVQIYFTYYALNDLDICVDNIIND